MTARFDIQLHEKTSDLASAGLGMKLEWFLATPL